MYFTAVLFVHSALCITLIGLVLLQQGKGADAGATFGGGSNSLFGAAGATDFITKLTTSLAVGFMITSILLIRAYTITGGQGVVLSPSVNRDIAEGSIMAPAAPAPAESDNSKVEFLDVDPKGGEAAKAGGDTAKGVSADEGDTSVEATEPPAAKEATPAAKENVAAKEGATEASSTKKDEKAEPAAGNKQ